MNLVQIWYKFVKHPFLVGTKDKERFDKFLGEAKINYAGCRKVGEKILGRELSEQTSYRWFDLIEPKGKAPHFQRSLNWQKFKRFVSLITLKKEFIGPSGKIAKNKVTLCDILECPVIRMDDGYFLKLLAESGCVEFVNEGRYLILYAQTVYGKTLDRFWFYSKENEVGEKFSMKVMQPDAIELWMEYLELVC